MSAEGTDFKAQLRGMPSPELKGLQKAIEKILADREDTDKKSLLDKFKAEAAAIGTSLEHLVEWAASSTKTTTSKNPAPIKYQGPNGEKWSGRGIAPTWLKTLENGGHNRDEFLIEKPKAPPAEEERPAEDQTAEASASEPERSDQAPEEGQEHTPEPAPKKTPRKSPGKRKSS